MGLASTFQSWLDHKPKNGVYELQGNKCGSAAYCFSDTLLRNGRDDFHIVPNISSLFRQEWDDVEIVPTLAQAINSRMTWEGSTPVNLISRPWERNVNRSWSMPNKLRTVAWKSWM